MKILMKMTCILLFVVLLGSAKAQTNQPKLSEKSLEALLEEYSEAGLGFLHHEVERLASQILVAQSMTPPVGPDTLAPPTRIRNEHFEDAVDFQVNNDQYGHIEPMFESYIARRKSVVGEQHIDIAVALQAYSKFLDKDGQEEESKTTAKKSKAIFDRVIAKLERELARAEKQTPDNTIAISTRMFNLGIALEASGSDSSELIRNALKVREKRLGRKHNSCLRISETLSRPAYSGDKEFIEELLVNSIAENGETHPRTIRLQEHLIPTLREKTDRQLQENKVFELLERKYGLDSPALLRPLLFKAIHYRGGRRWQRGEIEAARRAGRLRKDFGKWTPQPHHNFELAERYARRFLKISKRAFSTYQHPDYYVNLRHGTNLVAGVLFAADKKKELLDFIELELESQLRDFTVSGLNKDVDDTFANVFDNLDGYCAEYDEAARYKNFWNRNASYAFAKQLTDWSNSYSLTPEGIEAQLAQYRSALQGLCASAARSNEANQNKLAAIKLYNSKNIVGELSFRRNYLLHLASDDGQSSVVKEIFALRRKRIELSGGDFSQSNIFEERRLKKREENLVSQLAKSTRQQFLDLKKTDYLSSVNELDRSSAFIDIIRYSQFDFSQISLKNLFQNAIKQKSSWKAERYAAWLTFRDSIQVVDIGLASEIDPIVSKLRTALQKVATSSQSEGQNLDELGELLSLAGTKIWFPIEEHLKGIDDLILSPDGALWLLPWAAIPADRDSTGSTGFQNKFLIEERSVRFVTSARKFSSRKNKRPTSSPVVFSNPTFNFQPNSTGNSPRRGSRFTNVSPLPLTDVEAASVMPNINSLTGKKPVHYSKSRANEASVKTLERPHLAVFATHGFFFPENIAGSGIASSPLLRCGLLLAGSSEISSSNSQMNDGVLTGLEITNIDFRGTELVVLSACDTGVGDIRNGEGVAGLRQAFQLAGADSVLASLWQVDDAETARLMNLFFDNPAKGMKKSEALRQAQLTRIKDRRARHGADHPFFWAAFTLTGKD